MFLYGAAQIPYRTAQILYRIAQILHGIAQILNAVGCFPFDICVGLNEFSRTRDDICESSDGNGSILKDICEHLIIGAQILEII